MSLKDWLIKKLEKDVEPSAGHIDLEDLDEEKRNELIEQFGEGDEYLTTFLKTAFEKGAPSNFCCSGHNTRPAYVTLKVTEQNIELLQKLGKVLSNYGVVTNFTRDHIRGDYVSYNGKYIDTTWLGIASKILEDPEKYNYNDPSIYYHETFTYSYKPLGFDFKKKLLNMLRGTEIKQLPETIEPEKRKSDLDEFILSDEQKRELNEKLIQRNKENDNNIEQQNIDNDKEDI